MTQTQRTVPGSCGAFPTPKGGSETLGRGAIPGAPRSRGWSFLREGPEGGRLDVTEAEDAVGRGWRGLCARGPGPAGSTLQGGRPREGRRPAGRGNGRVKGFGLSPCLLSTPDWETEERPLVSRSPSKRQRSRPRTVRVACSVQTSGFPITDPFVFNVGLSARGWEAGEGGWAGPGSGNRDEGVGGGTGRGCVDSTGRHPRQTHRSTSWPQRETDERSNGVHSSIPDKASSYPKAWLQKKM